MPAAFTTASVEPNSDDKAIGAAHDKSLKMNGIILDDQAVYFGMDRSVSGRFVPVVMTTKGKIDSRCKNNFITSSQLEMVFDKVDRQISRMSDELNSGAIEAYPVSGSYTPCDNCEYKVICARERSAADRPVKSNKDIDELIKQLKQEREEKE